jgi:ABC-type Zn uptake system ZnuABC Zn-binding protein ZnuA
MGDVHPYGNPHFWFTPENVEIAVRNITDGLMRVDPEGTAIYERNRDQYLARVKATYEDLEAKMRPFQGTAVLQYHPSWDYFCEAMGLEIVGSLEPKPGIPPTPGHLRQIVGQARARDAKVLLVEPYYPKRPVRFVEEKAGVQALRLPLYLGGKKGIEDYLENLQFIVETIVSELGGGGV